MSQRFQIHSPEREIPQITTNGNFCARTHTPWYFFMLLFHHCGALWKLSVVSRCHSTGDKGNEKGFGYHQHRNEPLSLSARTTVLARTPARGSSNCATFSTCKWQCHQTLSFHQSSQGGHEYTKGKRGGSATSRSFARPNYKALSLTLSRSFLVCCLFGFQRVWSRSAVG